MSTFDVRLDPSGLATNRTELLNNTRRRLTELENTWNELIPDQDDAGVLSEIVAVEAQIRKLRTELEEVTNG